MKSGFIILISLVLSFASLDVAAKCKSHKHKHKHEHRGLHYGKKKSKAASAKLTSHQEEILKELRSHMISRGLGAIAKPFGKEDVPTCKKCKISKDPTGFGIAEYDGQGSVKVSIQGVTFPNEQTMEATALAVANFILRVDPRVEFVSIEISATTSSGQPVSGAGTLDEFVSPDPAVFGQDNIDKAFTIASGLSLIYIESAVLKVP